MCLVQDRRPSLEAVTICHKSKFSHGKFLHEEFKEWHDSNQTSNETPTLADEADESDIELANSFDHDLSFQQIPTGGLITLPRATTFVAAAMPAAAARDANTANLRLEPKLKSNNNLCERKPVHLHVECVQPPPPPFPSESYTTPTSAHRTKHARLETPPTPRHNRATRCLHFDHWPETLLMPQMSK